MIHLRTICVLALASLGMAVTVNHVYASPASDDSTAVEATSHNHTLKMGKKAKGKLATATNAKATNSSALAGQTDIVAKVDLPMVTNIMPWKDADENIPKNILEFSALKDSLTPTDRDRLAGEIRYTSILNQPLDQK